MSSLILEDLNKRLNDIEEEKQIILEKIKQIKAHDIVEWTYDLEERLTIEPTIALKEKEDKITDKYLPLPYDINEIIRNKIKEDSKIKKMKDHIDRMFLFIIDHYDKKIMNDVYEISKAYYHSEMYVYSDNLFEFKLQKLMDNLQLLSIGKYEWWCNYLSIQYFYNDNLVRSMKKIYNNAELKDYIDNKFSDLYNHYSKYLYPKLNDVFQNPNIQTDDEGNDIVKSLYNDTITLRKSDGKKNGLGFKKLKKELNSILYNFYYRMYIEKEDDYLDQDQYKNWTDERPWSFKQQFYNNMYSNKELYQDSQEVYWTKSLKEFYT